MVIKKNHRVLLILLCIALLFNFVFTTNVSAMVPTAITAATLAKYILFSGAAALGIYGVSNADLPNFVDDFLRGSEYIDDNYIGPFSAWTYGKFIDLHGKVYEVDANVNAKVQNLLNDFTKYVSQQVVLPKTIENNIKIDDNGKKYVVNDDKILYTTDIYDVLDKIQSEQSVYDVLFKPGDLNIAGTDIVENVSYKTILGTTVNCKVKYHNQWAYNLYSDYGSEQVGNTDLIYMYRFTTEGYLIGGFTRYDQRNFAIKGNPIELFNNIYAIAEIYDMSEYLSSGKELTYNQNIKHNINSNLYNSNTAELAAPNASDLPLIGLIPNDLGKNISHDSSISIADIINNAVVSDNYVARTAEYAKSIDYPQAPVLWKDITNQQVLERLAALEGELADYKTLPQELVLTPDIEMVKEYERVLADIKAQSPAIDFELGDSKINWDILKNIKIPQKFPFSIPWDIYKIIAVLQVPEERPVFNFAIKNYQFELDLGKYDEITKITRFFISLTWLGVMYTSFKRFKGD